MECNRPFPPLFDRLRQEAEGRGMDRDRRIPAADPGLLGDAQWRNFVERTDRPRTGSTISSRFDGPQSVRI
jgi:hypothetical protein